MYIIYIYLFNDYSQGTLGHVWSRGRPARAPDHEAPAHPMRNLDADGRAGQSRQELARADKSWPGWSYVNHSVKDAPTGYIHNDVVNRDKMHQHIWWYIHPCSFILMYIYIILFTQIYHRLHHLNMSISAMTSCMLPTYPEWFTWKWERLGAFLVPMGIQFQRCQSDIGIDPLLIPSP